LPTGAGQNYESLARFLSQKPTQSTYLPTSTENSFLTLYRLGLVTDDSQGRSHPESTQAFEGKKVNEARSYKRVDHFHAPHEFADVSPPGDKESESQIIFMRGFPSGEWLNLIGSKYRVDPEFFYRHLDFKPTDDRSSNFSNPPLPSSSWHLIRLPVMTNGTRDPVRSRVKQEDINRLRKEGDDALKAQHHRLMTRDFELHLGDSIIRHYHTFDEIHFSMEQRVSICMQERGNSFVSMLYSLFTRAFECQWRKC
jgi:hypothetical protein